MPGTATASYRQRGTLARIEVAFVADAGNGSIPSVALSGENGEILEVLGIDGSPAPTAGWSVTLTDADGVTYDPSDTLASRYLHGDKPVTLAFAGNLVHGAIGKVRITYRRTVGY